MQDHGFEGLPPLYKLDGRQPVRCRDMGEYLEWAVVAWDALGGRHVAESRVGETVVSTVFMPAPMGRFQNLFFETMVFGGPCDRMVRRYATWEEAEAGHQGMVAMAGRLQETA